MRLVLASLSSLIVLFPLTSYAQSGQPQQAQPATSISVPRLINLSGTFRPADGQPIARTEMVTFAIYAEEAGGVPLWQETQAVEPDGAGRYSVLLGATHPNGVPLEVFSSGEARWLGMLWARPGETESRRSRLTFVPYALRAADADTLGGRPASAYALASPSSVSDPTAIKADAAANKEAATTGADPENTNTVFVGGTNQLAKYVNGTDLTPSTVYEAGGKVGVGTTAPQDFMHVQFNNGDGSVTGYAVQNLGSSSASYSGTLFLDQTGAVAQFQGFNNSTHEYRINNVAKNVSNQYNGTINFMIGGTSRFLVSSGGSIGINVSNPFPVLDISNNNTSLLAANISSTTYQAGPFASIFLGRKARGTAAAPSAVQNGDNLALFQGRGFGATTFGPGGGAVVVRAFENWTDTAQGTALQFQTTGLGTTALNTVMTISPAGDVGIGTTLPAGPLEIARSSGDYGVVLTAYAGEASVVTRKARGGNPAMPTAALVGDELGGLGMAGYGTTSWGQGSAAMFAYTAENFTDTAQGAGLVFVTTPVGTTSPDFPMVITPSGRAGIGPLAFDGNGLPIVPDRLQVVGDIRVGTTGTNGCLKDFSGNGIAGSCSSDVRLKKDITPFGSVLDRLTALQPVHYLWRAAAFPERHFGTGQASGLIAQDVEQVLPELVQTDRDGFKTVNYSALPLLTIQAVKELKAENDQLKQRLADLERRLEDVLTAPGERRREGLTVIK